MTAVRLAILASALVLLTLVLTTVAPAVGSLVPRCDFGFVITVPEERIVLTRGQTNGPLDQYGVPHPVRHATVAMWRLDDGDVEGAVALADELLAIRDDRGFPYLFGWPAKNGFPALDPPWYSGMAQGKALGLFSRLYEATGEQRWLRAADATFATLPAYTHDGWISTFEFDEPDPILNGHIYALLGIHDYWRVTGRGEAELVSAVRVVGENLHRFDDGGWYDLGHRWLADDYYRGVVEEQLQELGRFAGCIG